MSIFTIDPDNNFTAFAELPADADESQSFSNQKELAKLTAEWPASRFVETWNSFAGVAPFDELKPIKKFMDRKAAVARIWKAVARLSPHVAPQAPDVAPAKGKAKKPPKPAKRPATARTGAKGANVSAAGVDRDSVRYQRMGGKKAEVVELMRRSQGVTLAEIMKLTGWQKHTVRGFVCLLGSKGGLKVESFRSEEKERTYRIKS